MSHPTFPTDARLPQLAVAFDPSRMAAVFGSQLPDGEVLDCRIERIKYRPGRNCSVAYRLRVRASRGQEIDQRVGTRFCEPAQAAQRHAKALRASVVPSAAGPAISHVPALGLVAHWAPNDPKLPVLRDLFDTNRFAGFARRAVLEAGLPIERLQPMSPARLVQYVPEHRVCACLDGRGVRLYVKADGEGRGGSTHAVMRALSASPASRQGELRTPVSLSWQAEPGLHWQLGLPGVPLHTLGPQAPRALNRALGAMLAALHRTPVPVARTETPSVWREAPGLVADRLTALRPAWRPLLQPLLQSLQGEPAGLDTERLATLHGDLHPRNVMVHRDRLALIDLDSLRRGPAVFELGAWVADGVYRAALQVDTNPRAAASAWHGVQAFLEGYLAAGGAPVPPAVLAWASAHQLLVQRAHRCLANLKPGRWECLPRLLAAASAIMRAADVEAGFAALEGSR